MKFFILFIATVSCSSSFFKRDAPLFTINRIMACSETDSKEKFVEALKTADAQKLTYFLNCPKSNSMIAQLTADDLKDSHGTIPEPLKTALQAKLDQFPYGSLQLDTDRTMETCITAIKQLQAESICKESNCTAADLDNFKETLKHQKSCEKPFMAAQLDKMVDVIKINRNVPSSNASRATIFADLQNILNTAPLTTIMLAKPINKQQEDEKYKARSKLKELLGVFKTVV